MKRPMTSMLRTRLAAEFALLALALVAGAAVLLHRWYRHDSLEELDARLGLALQALGMNCVVGSKGPEVTLPDETKPGASPPGEPPLWRLVRLRDGTILHRSSGIVPAAGLPMLEGTAAGPVFADVRLPDGDPVRVAGRWIEPPLRAGVVPTAGIEREAHLTAALSSLPLRAHLADARSAIAAGAALVLALLTGMAVWLLHRALRPLQTLSGEIARFPVGSASRFTVPHQAAELEPVVDRLNNLMERLGHTLARERSFAMGAAHELRTPLAGLRARLELALSRPRPAEEYRAALQEALAIERGLESMVGHLLLLARLGQEGRESFVTKPVDVGRLLRRCWGEFFDRAEERVLRVGIKVPEKAPEALTSEDLLGLLVRNLFDNAVSYTPRCGSIEISAAHTAQGWEIVVSNTNPGLREGDLPHLAEPFWRACHDEAARDGRHAGLGLALCYRIAEELGASLAHSLAVGGNRVAARLILPAPARPRPERGSTHGGT